MASTVNLKSGLVAIGALRPDDANSQEPVALETTVVATGARPGDATAKRELFTEETQTVLVFERGAVIRLSAAVADGQLLFLTNKSTGKEVVTQVVRKRSFRPTNCYVDLEFTEACPGFWGIDFPKAAATPSAAGASVAKKLAADEDTGDESAKPTAPPSAQEVNHLKQEVAALQTQLQSLMTSKPAVAPGTPEVAGTQNRDAVVAAGLQTGASSQPQAKAGAEISAVLAKKEEEQRLQELLAVEAEQEDASGPKILAAHPHISADPSAKKKIGKKLLSVAAALLILGAATFAAYRFGALDGVLKMAGIVKPAPSGTAPGVAEAQPPKPAPPITTTPLTTSPATTPAASATLPASTAAAPSGNESVPTDAAVAPLLDEKNPATVADAANLTDWKNNDSRGKSVVSSGSRSAPANSVSKSHSRVTSPAASSKPGKSRPSADATGQPASAASSPANPASSAAGNDATAAAPVDAEGVIAPKLISGHKSMAPPDMIRNYITGSVNVDAIVDATGHVHSVRVVSGPEKLRSTAIEEMKQYLYQPAKKNGKPVPAHVQVSLQFWYEP